MEPIINPWIIYWISVLSNLNNFASSLLFILSIAFVAYFIFVERKGLEFANKKIAYYVLGIYVFCIFLMILIPTKSAMYSMVIVNQITPDNLAFFKGEVKGLVDYIITQIQAVK